MASACVGSASGSTEAVPSSTANTIAQTVASTAVTAQSQPSTSAHPLTSTSLQPLENGGAAEKTAASVDHVVTEYDLQRFLAAAEFAIAGSDYEGAIYESPEIYIAIAQAFCARMGQGDGIGQIAKDYLAAANITKADDEDLQFVGALLGAGVETLCPEHASKL